MTDETPCSRTGYHQVTIPHTPVAGPVNDLRLEVDPQAIKPGESITFSLMNTVDEIRETGPQSTYAFQRKVNDERSETSWQNILYEPDTTGHRLILGRQQPGVVYTWTFTLTAERQLESASDDPHLGYICPELTPGAYRFVYWGTHTPDGVPAVEFSIE